ncbi:MAG: glycosyltransferase family 61 protein [Cyanobacteriota bacterium]
MQVLLHGRQDCHYRLNNPWGHPLGRIADYLRPIRLDPQEYSLRENVRLVTDLLVGVGRDRRIVEETLHLQEMEPRQRQRFRLRTLLPAQERIPGAVCSLVDARQWSDSYFHWFIDCLPRLIAVDDHARNTGENARVIVPARLRPWQAESLALLGIDAVRLIHHRSVRGGGLAVRRLIATVSHRWQRLGDAPFDALSPWAIGKLRDLFSAAPVVAAGSGPRRLYLSRRGVPNRQVTNEEEVMAVLSPHGFVAVQTETLTLSEQIALFRDATHIVAPHGASLTNLLHARQGSLLELFQEHHGVRPEFFQLAMINGLDYLHALCPSVGSGRHMHVDPGVLNDYLDITL